VSTRVRPLSAIAEARRRAGLSQQELAEVVGCSRAHLARMETAENEPHIGLALRISRVVGVPVEDLFREWSA
jgi:putative transcriptional regulator